VPYSAHAPSPLSYLSQKLPKPLPTKDGTVLKTIGEASAYMVELPEKSAQKNAIKSPATVAAQVRTPII
jgi:hypothetical protein